MLAVLGLHPLQETSIQTAGGVIYSTGRSTVGNLQNCLHVPELNVNLISKSHACKSDNSLSFVIKLGVLKIRDKLNRRPEYIYENVDDLCEVSDLRWLGINVIDDDNLANIASDLDNSSCRYIRSLVHEVYVAQLEVTKRELPTEEMTKEYREVFVTVCVHYQD